MTAEQLFEAYCQATARGDEAAGGVIRVQLMSLGYYPIDALEASVCGAAPGLYKYPAKGEHHE